ncbi:HNH endonuclease [Lentzea sp. CA-135723]|uniref:HNH endonuclease n=1 Tax=Lentzea sp. CA-135723 TaxID=3239950 RepID=UPI003D904C34
MVALVDQLAPAGTADRPVRHQGILLLWAIGRAKRQLPRLLRWHEAQEQLRLLFAALGREGSRPTPEYPFVALAGTPWWELTDTVDEIPVAHSSAPLKWLREHNPQGGLRIEVYNLMAEDAAARAEAVQALIDRFFHDGPATKAMELVGLDGIDQVTEGTQPGRDPAWAWDELVLACDLVARSEWHELPAEHPEVAELSALLQSLPIHAHELRGPKFRSPYSVRRKMADIATRHPDSSRKPTNGGKLDVEVLMAFLKRPGEMHAIADRLRSAAVAGEFDNLPATEEVVGDGEGALEGRLLERIHLRRERNPRLRARKIKKVLQERGTLACQVCGFDFELAYGARGEGYAECHHVVPLHASGEIVTELKDLAVLCANCHRMIHRGIDWLTPSELRDMVEARRAVTS